MKNYYAREGRRRVKHTRPKARRCDFCGEIVMHSTMSIEDGTVCSSCNPKLHDRESARPVNTAPYKRNNWYMEASWDNVIAALESC